MWRNTGSKQGTGDANAPCLLASPTPRPTVFPKPDSHMSLMSACLPIVFHVPMCPPHVPMSSHVLHDPICPPNQVLICSSCLHISSCLPIWPPYSQCSMSSLPCPHIRSSITHTRSSCSSGSRPGSSVTWVPPGPPRIPPGQDSPRLSPDLAPRPHCSHIWASASSATNVSCGSRSPDGLGTAVSGHRPPKAHRCPRAPRCPGHRNICITPTSGDPVIQVT